MQKLRLHLQLKLNDEQSVKYRIAIAGIGGVGGYIAYGVSHKISFMKFLLQIEEVMMTVVAIYFLHLHNLSLPTWIWILLFFSPDIGMLGYLFGNRVGAVSYNLFHHKGLALVLASCGYFVSNEALLASGILLFAHSSFDRIMGYGLKYFSDFHNTHLGKLGNKKSSLLTSASNIPADE